MYQAVAPTAVGNIATIIGYDHVEPGRVVPSSLVGQPKPKT